MMQQSRRDQSQSKFCSGIADVECHLVTPIWQSSLEVKGLHMMQQFRRDQGQSKFGSAMPELAWDSDQTALQPRMQISLLPPF